MKIIILAAGYATRLYPLTKNWPKPLLLVKEKPILTHILKRTEAIDNVSEVIVVSNDNYYAYFKKWQKEFKSRHKITILNDRVSSEKNKLGAIGDISFVIKNRVINEDILVIGGDNLFTFDLKKFIDFSRQKNPDCSIGLFRIKDSSMLKHYGVVELDKSGKIVRFQEKPKRTRSNLISMCVYYFPKESKVLLHDYITTTKSHDRAGDYISWLSKKSAVWGFELKGEWYDIGDLITFYHASVNFKD